MREISVFVIRKITSFEPQDIESTSVVATLYSKARATTLSGFEFSGKFSEKQIHCSQLSNGNKHKLDHGTLYRTNLEKKIF